MLGNCLTGLSFSFDSEKITIKKTSIIGLITSAWMNEMGKINPILNRIKIDRTLSVRMPL